MPLESEKSRQQPIPCFLQEHLMVVQPDLHYAGTSNNFQEFQENRLKICNDGSELSFADFSPLTALVPCPVFPFYEHTIAISPVLMMSSGSAPLLINTFACS